MKITSYDLWRRARALRSRATGELLVATGRSIKRLLLWPGRVAQARRELRMLMSLSDRQLRDIGVTQSDLISAANLPLGHDPSEFIARAVSERRRAQAAQGRSAMRALSKASARPKDDLARLGGSPDGRTASCIGQ